MRLIVNGAATDVVGPTVADLLATCLNDARPHGIAVAVNGEVVCRSDWPRWALAEADTVEIVTAVQGG
ncbi:sulfur carrier protein ThiS [Nocardioides humilatus]|uniref:Sulfur carrier protein ThiS n=1 Tax=Nocardioides humilatus TaxID=2607660 RepID=A0A5B1LNY8_9ACTN|nr:sulfur carrier protein ThiS [Nocardioides humilatus]KAA1421349.1 sulfur carrier protein ThiS [Nocardioides humilatus]